MKTLIFIWALCPMCQTSLANAEDAAGLSATVNDAVLVLLVPTLLIIGGLVRLVLKYRHSQIDSHDNFRSSDHQRNFE